MHRLRHSRSIRIIPAELIVGEDPELDDQRFVRSPNGVTLITQEMLDRVASNV